MFKHSIETIQEWSNTNSGYLSLLLFIVGLIIPLIIWLYKRKSQRKINLKLEIDKNDQATLCTSFDTGNIENNIKLHRTAFIVYLKITNLSRQSIVIDKVRLGYKSQSQSLKNPENWYWLNQETLLLEDYKVSIGDKYKVYPFLKQKSNHSNTVSSLRIEPNDYINGVVYFEQKESKGLDLPYMDEDYRVKTIVVITDTHGREWSTEYRVLKVKIDAIRQDNPLFGLSIASCQ